MAKHVNKYRRISVYQKRLNRLAAKPYAKMTKDSNREAANQMKEFEAFKRDETDDALFRAEFPAAPESDFGWLMLPSAFGDPERRSRLATTPLGQEPR